MPFPFSFRRAPWLALLLALYAGASSLTGWGQTLPNAPAPAPGELTGIVVDLDGDFIQNAHVQVTAEGSTSVQEAVTNAAGEFHLAEVPAGPVTLVAKAEGWASVTVHAVVSPGGVFAVPAITLSTPTASFSVEALTQHQAAELEVKKAEQQRLLGILPNFGVVYNWQAPPIDSKQKFELATRIVIDPVTFGVNLATVAVARAGGGYSSFGPGQEGFWKLYGAVTLDTVIGNELAGAVYPTIFHQDPRYFWKGTGTVRSRVFYALSRAVVCRGDNGKNQPSYSGILGSFSAGALSNLYYPKSERNGAAVTFEHGLIDIGSDALGNVVQEFVFKFFTPKSRKVKPNVPQDSVSTSTRAVGTKVPTKAD